VSAEATKKANATLGFLRRNLRHYPTGCKRSAYRSLVRSVLEYGAIVWDPYAKKDIDALERVQRGAARFITGDYRSRTPGSIQKLLKKLDLPTLQDRRKQLRLCFFYKVVEELVPAIPPQNFLVRFVLSNIIDTYIRNNDRCYSIKPCKTDQFRNSFFLSYCCRVECPGQQCRQRWIGRQLQDTVN
jgi:hypothetical protein